MKRLRTEIISFYFLASVLSVSLPNVKKSKILAGIIILQIIAIWHDGMTNFSGPLETRKLQRACSDAFLHNYFTSYDFGANVFGHRPRFGEGLYQLIRNHVFSIMAEFFPKDGLNKVKDFSKGIKY